MNLLNYATLEASQRLVNAGIVLETEVYWFRDEFTGKWKLVRQIEGDKICDSKIVVPAPSMAEVWRELPDAQSGCVLTARKQQREALAGYEHSESWAYYVRDANPTDALIDLLIWVTEQRKEKG